VAAQSFWIGVASRSHVELGVNGGFIQLNHGMKAPLLKLRASDGVILYSPRTSYPDGEVLQSFTAIGVVRSGEIYQVTVNADFKPYRVEVKFHKCCEAPIRPLINQLSFIKNKTHWGAVFRFGHLKVSADDFYLIGKSMRCEALEG